MSVIVEDANADAATLTSEKESLPKSWIVTVEGEQTEVSTLDIRTDLTNAARHPSDPEIRKRLSVQLGFMLREAKALHDSEAPDGIKARGKLDEILKGREFASLGKQAWLDSLRERFFDWLDRLFGRPRSAEAGTEAMKGIAWILTAALFALAAVWAYRISVRIPPGELLHMGSTGQDASAGSRWAQRAADAANEGDYREAVRCAYWAAVQSLAERGVWTADFTRTHREYLRLLPEADARRPALSAMTSSFESSWYGGRGTTRQDFTDTMAHLETLRCSIPWIRVTERS